MERWLDLLKCFRPPNAVHAVGRSPAERQYLYARLVRRWQWSVFYALMVLLACQAVTTALIWGWTPAYAGFLPRSEGQQTNDRTARIELRLLKQDLLTTTIGQCRATDKAFFTGRLEDLKLEYFRMTGTPWTVPACRELVP